MRHLKTYEHWDDYLGEYVYEAGNVVYDSIKKTYYAIEEFNDEYVWWCNSDDSSESSISMFNWNINENAEFKIYTVSDFLNEFPQYIEEFIDIYNTVFILNDIWKNDEEFLTIIESNKFNL